MRYKYYGIAINSDNKSFPLFEEELHSFQGQLAIYRDNLELKNNERYIRELADTLLKTKELHGKGLVPVTKTYNSKDFKPPVVPVDGKPVVVRWYDTDILQTAKSIIDAGVDGKKIAILNPENEVCIGGGAFVGAPNLEEIYFRCTTLALSYLLQAIEDENFESKKNSRNGSLRPGYKQSLQNTEAHFTEGVTVLKHIQPVFKDDGSVDHWTNHTYTDLNESKRYRIGVVGNAAFYLPKPGGFRENPGHWFYTRTKARIKAQIVAMAKNGVTYPIFTDFGCGAFKNSPFEIAEIYHDILFEQGYSSCFKEISFAIIASENRKEFQKGFWGRVEKNNTCYRELSYAKYQLTGESKICYPQNLNSISFAKIKEIGEVLPKCTHYAEHKLDETDQTGKKLSRIHMVLPWKVLSTYDTQSKRKSEQFVEFLRLFIKDETLPEPCFDCGYGQFPVLKLEPEHYQRLQQALAAGVLAEKVLPELPSLKPTRAYYVGAGKKIDRTLLENLLLSEKETEYNPLPGHKRMLLVKACRIMHSGNPEEKNIRLIKPDSILGKAIATNQLQVSTKILLESRLLVQLNFEINANLSVLKAPQIYYDQSSIDPCALEKLIKIKSEAPEGTSFGVFPPQKLSAEERIQVGATMSACIFRCEAYEFFDCRGEQHEQPVCRSYYFGRFPNLRRDGLESKKYCRINSNKEIVLQKESEHDLKQDYQAVLELAIKAAAQNKEGLDIVTPNAFFQGLTLESMLRAKRLFAQAVIEVITDEQLAKAVNGTFPALFLHDNYATELSIVIEKNRDHIKLNAVYCGTGDATIGATKGMPISQFVAGDGIGPWGNAALGDHARFANEENIYRRTLCTLGYSCRKLMAKTTLANAKPLELIHKRPQSKEAAEGVRAESDSSISIQNAMP